MLRLFAATGCFAPVAELVLTVLPLASLAVAPDPLCRTVLLVRPAAGWQRALPTAVPCHRMLPPSPLGCKMASFIGYKLPDTSGPVDSAQVLESAAQAFSWLKRGLIFEREDAAVAGLFNLANHCRVVGFTEPQLVAAGVTG